MSNRRYRVGGRLLQRVQAGVGSGGVNLERVQDAELFDDEGGGDGAVETGADGVAGTGQADQKAAAECVSCPGWIDDLGGIDGNLSPVLLAVQQQAHAARAHLHADAVRPVIEQAAGCFEDVTVRMFAAFILANGGVGVEGQLFDAGQ